MESSLFQCIPLLLTQFETLCSAVAFCTADGTPAGSAVVVGVSAGVYNISMNPGSLVDRVVIREDISHGQRVRGWTLEAEVDGQWVPTPYAWGDVATSNGTGVGNRFVALFKPITTSSVRLTITKAAAAPMLMQFAAFAPGPCALPEGNV